MRQAILRQLNLLNFIIFSSIIAFSYFFLLPIFTIEVKLPAASGVPLEAVGQKQEGPSEQTVNPPLQEYAVIAEKNLFHPDRVIPPEKKAEIAVPRPEFVLYGTLIADNVSIAYMSDKKAVRTTPGRGKRQVGLKLGETLSGYTLKEVFSDRVVMVRGDDRIEIRVISPENKKDRIVETTSPTQQTIPSMMPTNPMMPGTQPSAIPGIPMAQPRTSVGGTTSASPQSAGGYTSPTGRTSGQTSVQPPGMPSGPPPGQPLQPSGPSGPTGPIYYQPGMRRAAPGQ